jgi:beta-glucanase (GH16 family)
MATYRTRAPKRRQLPQIVAAATALFGVVAALTACEPGPPTPAIPTTTSTPTTTQPPEVGWEGDEFNGTDLDTTRWGVVSGTYGNSGGGSRHCLTPQNVQVSSGTLKITSTNVATRCPNGSIQPYSSGFIGSRDAGRYYPLEGTFSIRARVPAAQGIWPAFWLRHRDGASVAEVDIMESFHSQVPGQVSQALHLDGEVNAMNRSTPFEAPSDDPGWHEFAVRIEHAENAVGQDMVRFDFSVDGHPTATYTDVDPAWLVATDPAQTWDIAVNTAVDGRWVGDPDGTLGVLDQLNRCSVAGAFPDCSADGIRRVDWDEPTVFEVDWVRVTPHRA